MKRRGKPVSVLCCRGCCCGRASGVDHDGQLAQLERAARATGGSLRTCRCLGMCDQSNVVVLRARQPDGSTACAWLGGVVDEAVTRAVAAWIRAGGPGAAEPPELVAGHLLTPAATPSAVH